MRGIKFEMKSNGIKKEKEKKTRKIRLTSYVRGLSTNVNKKHQIGKNANLFTKYFISLFVSNYLAHSLFRSS